MWKIPEIPFVFATLTGFTVAQEAIIVGLLCLVLPLLLCVIKLRVVAKFYARHDQNQIFTTVLTGFLPTIVAIIGSYADLFRGATWQNPTENILLPVGASFALGSFVYVLKVYENAAKSFLSGDLKALKAHRDASVYTAQLFTTIVKEKLGRVYKARSQFGGKLSQSQFVSELNPKAQLAFLFRAAHQHIVRTLPHGSRLRLSLYRRSADGTELERIFGWNGAREDCYSDLCKPYMRLEPNPTSELVKAFFGREDLVIIQSADVARRTGKYQNLRPDHHKNLKSMIIYRHTLPEEYNKGGAMLLELDTDLENFFLEEERGTYEEFFVALMRRVEYEYVVADVADSFSDGCDLDSGMRPALNNKRSKHVQSSRKTRT